MALRHQSWKPLVQQEFLNGPLKRGARYTDCSKHEGKEVENFECIGHCQKRVVTRLLKLKKNNKGLGELTKPIIDMLLNYSGISPRSHLSTVEDMRKAIFASFLHVASTESNNYHAQCNISWRQSRRDSANITNLYKPGVGLCICN